MTQHLKNWAGNYTYSAARVHYPETLDQVQQVVRAARKVKPLGTCHSFNSIADCDEDLLSLARFDQSISISRRDSSVTVGAGVRYGMLCRHLDREGFALHNLASLPHISIAGACATATHGSGGKHGNLATAVRALELVTADGEVVVLSRERDGDRFNGAVVGLGALGVVTKLTLDLVPAFTMRQDVYEHLPLSQVEAHLDEILDSGYSVSLFTDWSSETINQIWIKREMSGDGGMDLGPEWFGAIQAREPRHPIASLSAVNCTEQMGVAGPWHERLPHFRLDYTPSSGEELQSEYFVPRQHALAALRAIHSLGDRVAPLLQISEIRTIAADELWMSPCYRQNCIAIHFTWVKDWQAVKALLPAIEERLAPLGARPHWGKLFTIAPARVRSLYERLPDFEQLAVSLDPHGKFRNAFLNTYIFDDQEQAPRQPASL